MHRLVAVEGIPGGVVPEVGIPVVGIPARVVVPANSLNFFN